MPTPLNRLIALVALLLLSRPAAAQRVFPHPDRIRYDGQCFTIEGKDTFIFSGAFHYFRCPKELWNDRFDKIKAAGFNCVETYVAWDVQEPAMPASVNDYSKVDMKDLDDWLTQAESHGLYVILRPGPYICAEWDRGGFPGWLLTKKPDNYHTGHMWLRSDDPTFVAWSKHWFHAVDQVAVKHQITNRKPGTGGIIIYQLENEYGGNQPDDVEVRYLHALGQQALDDGIDVPFMTCWTAVVRGSTDPILKQCYDSCNFYPGWNVDGIAGQMDKLRKEQPDAPMQTTELQGGWFGNVGAKGTLSKDWTSYAGAYTPAQIQNLTLYAIAKGDRVTNYYMLFGGTNFGDWAPDGITTSYDYSAPIRECGGVDEKYRRVAAIGRFLHSQGEGIARATNLTENPEFKPKSKIVIETGSADVHASLIFNPRVGPWLIVRNSSRDQEHRGMVKFTDQESLSLSVDYALGPFEATVYSLQGNGKEKKWVAMELAPTIERPAAVELPSPVELKEFLTRPDDGPAAWRPLANGPTLEKPSLEQLGVNDRRYVFYRAFVRLTEEGLKAGPLSLAITCPRRDHLTVRINGVEDPTITIAGSHAAKGLKPGDNTIEILYENVGQPNGGSGMEEMGGIRRLAVQNPHEAGVDSITGWRMLKLDPAKKPWVHPADVHEVAADFDSTSWPETKADELEASQLRENESAVFRTTIDVSAEQMKNANPRLVIDRMDDGGWVFVNGQKVGEGHSWSDSFSFPVTLHEGKNTIAILVRNEEGHGGLGPVHLVFGPVDGGLPMDIGLSSKGFAGNWASDTGKDGWGNYPADIGIVPRAAALNWYRTSFELPATKPHLWVPWVARLDLSGNGKLYLNGHPLGRYWQVGPQHDFFLPECWLNFGPGKTNILTICGRDMQPWTAAIKSAQVVPVNELAEIRP
jgi:hypothetical protein